MCQGKFVDLTGKKFGRLSVVNRVDLSNKRTKLLCRCDCGNESITNSERLLSGMTKSCGCLNRELAAKRCSSSQYGFRHGLHKSRFYRIWRAMTGRAGKARNYKSRPLCDKWMVFENFRDDMYVSYLKHVQEFGVMDTTIERVNNDLGYFPENCRWATRMEQNRNTKTNVFIEYKGMSMCITDWAKYFNMNLSTFHDRIKQGWELAKIDFVYSD